MAGVPDVDLVKPRAQREDLARLDLDVGRLPLGAEGSWIMTREFGSEPVALGCKSAPKWDPNRICNKSSICRRYLPEGGHYPRPLRSVSEGDNASRDGGSFGGGDVGLYVLFQQQTLVLQLPRRGGHQANIRRVVLIALLQ